VGRPTRFESQSDAVSLIFSAKTQANPESSVGLMTMGGKGPEVLVTLTEDFGKILSGLHGTKIKGELHLTTGIQVAGVRILRAMDHHAQWANIYSILACSQASAKQGPEATNYMFCWVTNPRR